MELLQSLGRDLQFVYPTENRTPYYLILTRKRKHTTNVVTIIIDGDDDSEMCSAWKKVCDRKALWHDELMVVCVAFHRLPCVELTQRKFVT